MTVGTEFLSHRRLRAPRSDRGVLADPPLDRAAELIVQNAKARAEYDYDLQGRPLTQVSKEARKHLRSAALAYTRQYRDAATPPADGAILLAGHQAEMFHPGVWSKNFALSALAAHTDSTAINLIVDTDITKQSMLRVPAGTVEQPRFSWLPVDATGPGLPTELRGVLDPARFESFGQRACNEMKSIVPQPVLREYWPRVLQRWQAGAGLGYSLAQGRHQLEGDWGLDSLELPLSATCTTRAFGWFVAHLLAHLPRFWSIYNQTVGEYRRANRIRSSSHPVPDLAADDRWLEAPFWIWHRDDPRRRRLFVCQQGDELVLSDRGDRQLRLNLRPEADASSAAEQLFEWQQQGVCLRTRALTTTLWSRLVLGDLFVHGIGGAKYDQVTDALIARFFGLAPPEFVTLSATLQLPVQRERTTPEQVRRLAALQRELDYHPERFFSDCAVGQPAADRLEPPVSIESWEPSFANWQDGSADAAAAGQNSGSSQPCAQQPEVANLIAAKQQWVRTQQTPANAALRHREIERINRSLQPWLEDIRARLAHEESRRASRLRAEQVLAWREWAFCIYPAETLRDFLLAIAPPRA